MARCWGINRNLKRCQRVGDWAFFCDDHKRQPIKWLYSFVFVFIVGLIALFNAFNNDNDSTVIDVVGGEIKPFGKDDYGIIVCPFIGGSEELNEKGKEYQNSLSATLSAELGELDSDETKVIVYNLENFRAFQDHGEARIFGKKFNAGLVIWGDVTLRGVIPKLTIINNKKFEANIIGHQGEVTILKSSLTHEFINSLTNIRIPPLTKEPSIVALFSLGYRYLEKKDYRKSLYFFKKALPLNPLTTIEQSKFVDVSQIITAIGLCYYRLSEIEKAKNNFLRAFKMSPKNSVAGLLLGLTYLKTGDSDKALATFSHMYFISFLDKNTEFKEIFSDLKNERYDSAIHALTLLREKNKTDNAEIALLLRGSVFYKKEDWKKAIHDFTGYIAIKPKFFLTYRLRSNCYHQTCEFNKEINDLNTYIEMVDNPDSGAYSSRAIAYFHIEEFDKA